MLNRLIIFLFLLYPLIINAKDSTYFDNTKLKVVFSELPNSHLLRRLTCIDDKNCVAFFDYEDAQGEVIRRTSDGGYHWTIAYADTGIISFSTSSMTFAKNYMSNIEMVSNKMFVTTGDSMNIFISKDSCKTWNEHYFADKNKYFPMNITKFISENLGIASGYLDNQLYITKNGGSNWDTITISNVNLNSYTLSSDSIIYSISNDRPNIFSYSKDFGKNWNKTKFNIYDTSQVDLHINCILCNKKNEIWIYGTKKYFKEGVHNMIILFSKDNGITWEEKLSLNYPGLMSQNVTDLIINENGKAYALGMELLFFYTPNYYTTNFKLKASNARPGYSTFGIAGKNIVIGNAYGDILMLEKSYLTEVEENPTTINNISYYPNPTKETLNLKLSSEPELNEELTITDILGNNVLKAPIKDIQSHVDISYLVSGLYLCRLRQSGTVFKIEVMK